MRALIVDDSEDFRQLAARFIAIDWPEGRIAELDPTRDVRPDAHFPWGDYDVVLLDYDLGTDNGLAWLKAWTGLPVPPVIFLTAKGNESIAVQALKAGAADYLRKDDLSRARLNEAIREAIGERTLRTAALREQTLPLAEVLARSAGTVPDTVEISGYRVIRKLGEGATSSVYLTQSAKLDAPVVLKVLDGKLSHQSDYLERFIAEYGAISKISSPHVVRIHDQGFSSEHAFLAMEYLPGGDLRNRINGPLEPAVALRYFSQIVRALVAIHGAGVVHRDLKPQNMLFKADDTLAIVDFGIARDSARNAMTLEGELLGTPYYMSPEQCQGAAVDARSDLYGAGVILYEMLVGHVPFRQGAPLAVIFQHLQDPVPPLPAHLAKFQPLVDRLLAKDPAARFASAREVMSGRASGDGTLPPFI